MKGQFYYAPEDDPGKIPDPPRCEVEYFELAANPPAQAVFFDGI